MRVVSPFVGGAFGSGLRPHYQLFLAAMAALELKRSVRVVLTRQQMFTLRLPARTPCRRSRSARTTDGTLAGDHPRGASPATSRFEDYSETVVNWSGLLYPCDNAELDYKLAELDTQHAERHARAGRGHRHVRARMRDGRAGLRGRRSTRSSCASATTPRGTPNDGKPFSSKALRECYRLGAERFGWTRRKPEPRSMRDGRELVGWGMATGVWEAQMHEDRRASAELTADGTLEVASATATSAPAPTRS